MNLGPQCLIAYMFYMWEGRPDNSQYIQYIQYVCVWVMALARHRVRRFRLVTAGGFHQRSRGQGSMAKSFRQTLRTSQSRHSESSWLMMSSWCPHNRKIQVFGVTVRCWPAPGHPEPFWIILTTETQWNYCVENNSLCVELWDTHVQVEDWNNVCRNRALRVILKGDASLSKGSFSRASSSPRFVHQHVPTWRTQDLLPSLPSLPSLPW